MITVKITKTRQEGTASATDTTELKGDPSEVMSFLDELGFTHPPPADSQETETVH